MMITGIPERALVTKQKAFTVEVSEEMAKAIQKELNKHAKRYGVGDDEWITAEQFVREHLVGFADELASDMDPYNY